MVFTVRSRRDTATSIERFADNGLNWLAPKMPDNAAALPFVCTIRLNTGFQIRTRKPCKETARCRNNLEFRGWFRKTQPWGF